MQWLGFAITGILVGACSAFLGLGGGILTVPILVLIFGFSQHMAQGTSLAMMVPPIGLLAAWVYYKNGYVHLPAAVLLCLGFVAGSVLGARIAIQLPEIMLKRIFAVLLISIALRLFFGK